MGWPSTALLPYHRQVSRRAEANEYVLIAVPIEDVERVEKFCRAIRIVSAPDPNRPAISSSLPSATGPASDLTDEEVREFVHLLFSFALDTYTKGQRRSAAQCIIYHVFTLVSRGRADFARAIVDAAKQDQDARQLLQDFFRAVGTDEWETALDALIRTGNLQRSLGMEAQAKISTSNRDNHKFIDAFKRYLAGQRMDAEKKRRIAGIYTALLASLLLPRGAQAAPSMPHGGMPVFRIFGGTALATALLAGIAFVVVTTVRDEARQKEAVFAEGPERLAESEPPPAQSPLQPTTASALDACLTGRNGFESKACLIREANRARPTYARAVALYKRAITFDYDPAGLGKRGEIPERYLSTWQSTEAYESLATLHSENGRYREALAAHRERLRLKEGMQSGAAWQMLFFSLDCTILAALERRANGGRAAIDSNDWCMAKNPYPSDVDTDFHTYELARAYEDAGWQSEAVQALAAIVGPGMGAPPNPTTTWMMTSSVWKHLVNRPQEIEDSRRRLTTILESLQSREHAIITSDLAVWLEPDRATGGYVIGLLVLRLRPSAACRVDDVEGSTPSKTWSLSVETGGKVVEIKRPVPGLSPNSPRSTMPWYGQVARTETSLPVDIVVKLAMTGPATLPRGCFDQTVRTRVCVLADGRLVGADRCP